MRFIISGEWSKNHLLKIIILFFLGYIALFWVTNIMLFVTKIGVSYDDVVAYYRGSEGRFMQPRSLQGLLEVSHFHLFAMGILMLTLTHLVLFIPLSVRTKISLILAAFLSALGDEAAGWLTRFVSPLFAYLKLAAFLSLQATILILIVLAAGALLREWPSDYASSYSRRRPREDPHESEHP